MAAATCDNREKKTVENGGEQSIGCVSSVVPTSKDLLEIGNNNGNSLLITKACKSKKTSPPKIFKPPPSSVLRQVKHFLPQMAAAQKDLTVRLLTEPEENFDIENVDDCDKVIEMTLALVEQGSDSDESDDGTDSEDGGLTSLADAGADLLGPVTEGNLRLPGPKEAPRIEVLTDNAAPSTDCLSTTPAVYHPATCPMDCSDTAQTELPP